MKGRTPIAALRRVLACGVFLGLSTAPAVRPAESEDVSRQTFLDAVAAALTLLDPPVEVQATEGLDLVATREGHSVQIGTQRAYEEFRAEPERKDELVAKLVRLTEEALQRRAQAPSIDRVVPVVKRAEQLAAMGYRGPVRELPAGLVAILVEDLPERFEYLDGKDVEALGLPEEELWERSLDNLATLAPPKVERFESVLMVTSGGNYEASLLLDPQLAAALEQQLETRVVFAAPTHDLFLLAGQEDEDGRARLAAAVCRATARESGGQLTRGVFSREKGRLALLAEVDCSGAEPRWVAAGDSRASG